jgi:hypothetical protein
MSLSPFGALILAKPDEARATLLDAIVRAKGDRKGAATILKVTTRSFYRSIDRMKLWAEIEKLEAEKGFMPIPGPPHVRHVPSIHGGKKPAPSADKIKATILVREGDVERAARDLEISPETFTARVDELKIWGELNRILRAAKFPVLERTRKAG